MISGVASLEWARVQRFQKGPSSPLQGSSAVQTSMQSPYSGNFWVILVGLNFVIQTKVRFPVISDETNYCRLFSWEFFFRNTTVFSSYNMT